MRQRKPIHFSWRLEKEWCKNGVWGVWHEVFGSDSVEREMGKTVNNHKKFEGKPKRFKNWPTYCQTRVFRDWGESPTSRQGKPPKRLKTKLWKNFLSVFRDWKVYPRGSRELSHENLCVPLAIGLFTCEQVAKINTRARGCSMRLGWLVTESPKQGNTVFEIF